MRRITLAGFALCIVTLIAANHGCGTVDSESEDGGTSPEADAGTSPEADAGVPDPTPPTAGGPITFQDVTTRGAKLAWPAATDVETEQGALEYRVYRVPTPEARSPEATESDGTPLTNWTVELLTFAATELAPFTPYAYTVLVRDADGMMAAYATAEVITLADGAPTPAGAPRATAIGRDGFTLQWDAASDAEDATETLQYRAYLSTDAALDTVEHVLDVGVAVGDWSEERTVVATGLDEAATYRANVLVRDSSGTLAAYNAVSVRTLDQTPPAVSGVLAFSELGLNALVVSWEAATDNATETANLEYRAFASEQQNLGTLAEAETNGRDLTEGWQAALTNVPVVDLLVHRTYHFAVFVRDEAGNVATWPGATATTLSDAAPTAGTLSSSDATAGSVQLTWTAATHPTGPIEYRAYFAADSALDTVDRVLEDGTPAGPWTSALSVTLTGLAGATEYEATVLARGPTQASAPYAPITFRTLDTVAPVPSAVTATLVPPATVRVTWENATDGATYPQELEYRAEIVTGEVGESPTPGAGTLLSDWSTGTRAATAIGLAGSTQHSVLVFVRDAAGNVASVASTVTTGTVEDTILFSPPLSGGGALGGRAGADLLCEDLPDGVSCPNAVHAFLSVDAEDTLASFPQRYGLHPNRPIRTAEGTLLTDDWGTLLSGSLSLASLAGQVSEAWTGMSPGGGVAPDTCVGWTAGATMSVITPGSDGGSDGGGEGSTSGGDPSTSGGDSSGGPPPDPTDPGVSDDRGASVVLGTGTWTETSACSSSLRLLCVCY